MAFFLHNIARFAAKKIAADPRAREHAAKAARVVADEAKQIAREKNKAEAAGRALRRVIKKLQGGQ